MVDQTMNENNVAEANVPADGLGASGWRLPVGTPRRWLVLTQYYPPEVGAPQVRLSTLVRVLRKKGLDVEVLTAMPNYPTGIVPPAYRGKFTAHEQIEGVLVHRGWVYAYGGAAKLHRILNYFSFTAVAVMELFRRRRPDVIFIESQPLPIGILGVLAKAVWRVPYIYNIPDMQIEAARDMGYVKSEWILNVAASFENMLMRNAWRTSTVTFGFRDFFRRERGIPRGKLTMLPNGADTSMFCRRDPDPETIRRYGLEGKTVFVYAGTITGAHAPQVMVQAAELIRHRDDIRILIVGGGPKRPVIMDMAREKNLNNLVFGANAFTPDEIPALMSVSRAALVTLSQTRVHKILRVAKTWPPLACGKPVIFSGEGESAQMVADHDVGLVTAPEDPRSFADAMLRLADDEIEAQRLGANGERFVRRELNWESIVERWLDEAMAGGFPANS